VSVAVREARPSDLGAALPLWRALHAEHEALDARYRMAEDAAARWASDFREWTRSVSSRVWLAVDAVAPVGLLTAHLYEPAPTFQPSLFVHVDDLYVAPPHRGTGLGTRLLDQARDWARAEQAEYLQVGVLAANTAARAFWARQGGAEFSVTMRLGESDIGAAA